MIGAVILEDENEVREWMGGPFYDLGVAVSAAITLADALGQKMPLLLGRLVRVECNDELEISFAVIPGGGVEASPRTDDQNEAQSGR